MRNVHERVCCGHKLTVRYSYTKETGIVMEESEAAAMPTTEQCLSTGDTFYVDENYSDAIDSYAAALSVLRETEPVLRFRILSHRSGAFYQLGRYEEALEDAIEAGKMVVPSGLLPGESEACSRREGLAAFKLERYEHALKALKAALQLASLNKRETATYQDLIRKCQQFLEPESKPSHSSPREPKITQKAAPLSAPKPVVSPSASSTTVASAHGSTGSSKPTAPRYQYYQSDKFMTISILEPNVQRDQLNVTTERQRIAVVLRKAGEDFTIVAGTLYQEINTELSKVQIKDEKVLIKLRKVNTGYEWPELLGKEAKSRPKPPVVDKMEDVVETPVDSTASTTTAQRTRPYVSHRDWDSIEKDLKAEEEKEKPEGDDAMNKLFQSIYANADEDTKRAMIKSYQTSGGTVLSTNWSEVAEKDYEKERTAPDGMEWKTWEGDKLRTKEDD